MARTRAILSLALTFLVLAPGSLAQLWGLQGQTPGLQSGQSLQPRRLIRGQQIQNQCDINRLSAIEPTIRRQSEAGLTEIWEPNEQEFQCVGVTVIRHTIEPKGLFLPMYTNAPLVSYIIRGRAIMGVNIPGCPETYESSESSEELMRGGREMRGSEGSTTDRHQKVRRLRQGDVLALPAGVSKWIYNDGENPLVQISMYDTNNVHNQLDQNLREFFLAGNPENSQQEQGRHQQSRHQQSRRHSRESIRRGRGEEGNNIFSGFDEELLAEAFGVDTETINQIQGQQDQRGEIIRVERDLEFLSPEWEIEEERQHERHQRGRGGRYINGLEETFCSARLMQNIDDPQKADVFNPKGGRLTTLNSHKLPILNFLQLNAERVNLYQNAMLAPHWRINAHSICYFTKGQGRVQVVNNEGRSVFDDMVQEGQLLVIPQNFAVVKKAGREGLEWVNFLTNDEAMISPLAGRISAIRGMPMEVVMNAYGISREDARQLKYAREEMSVFTPSERSQRRGREEYAIV